MLKKQITYTDPFENVQRTEDFYFHLTKAELIIFVSAYPSDFEQYVNRLMRADDKAEFFEMFRRLIMMSYGKRNGSSFEKTPAISEAFTHTEAYSELFIEIFTEEDKMISFFNGVLGVDLAKLAEEAQKKQ